MFSFTGNMLPVFPKKKRGKKDSDTYADSRLDIFKKHRAELPFSPCPLKGLCENFPTG